MDLSRRLTPTDYPTRAAAYRTQALRWRRRDESTLAAECEEYARRCDALAVRDLEGN
ncbi:hypothetical protein [Mycobacteroides abscessus]|uniref:hypothetical protein n=1 Tax=Mycobacteroides abscessus TaxID=36809 RepID=UPI0013FD065A|nr:hypothetical protein [Mycobacteroides abscessus]MBN7488233.1 hypothetical protein [Mycobacteroides abscessus subsp. abscessus]